MRLSRVIHAAEPGRTRPLAGKGGCTREPWGVGRGGGAGVPQSRLVVGAWAEHTWPLSYPPQRRLPLAGRAEVLIHRVEGSRGSRERGAAPTVTSLCPKLQGGSCCGGRGGRAGNARTGGGG